MGFWIFLKLLQHWDLKFEGFKINRTFGWKKSLSFLFLSFFFRSVKEIGESTKGSRKERSRSLSEAGWNRVAWGKIGLTFTHVKLQLHQFSSKPLLGDYGREKAASPPLLARTASRMRLDESCQHSKETWSSPRHGARDCQGKAEHHGTLILSYRVCLFIETRVFSVTLLSNGPLCD